MVSFSGGEYVAAHVIGGQPGVSGGFTESETPFRFRLSSFDQTDNEAWYRECGRGSANEKAMNLVEWRSMPVWKPAT